MKLFSREYGQGKPFIILHGLFGSSDNCLTQAKLLATSYKVYTLDLRNHGQSPHDDAFDYKAMVQDLDEFMEEYQIRDSVLLGHSMGGKVAMNLALAHPDKLQKLIVVDIAPKPYNMEDYIFLKGLNAIQLDKVTTRQDTDDALAHYVDDGDVRQLLLKKLQRKPEVSFKWKLNLPAMTRNILNIWKPLQVEGKFMMPNLFIRGSRSNYIKDHDFDRIRQIFPAAEFETLDAGHWVPA